MLSGSFEYDSDDSLAIFKDHIERAHKIDCTIVAFQSEDDHRSLELIDDTDVLMVFTRRINTIGLELDRFKRYCQQGRPIVGVRTASHAFQNWLDFDREILGGNYGNHYGEGPTVGVQIVPEAYGHPVLKGITDLESKGSLYRNTPIADDTTLLLNGITDEASEPVAWTRTNLGGRVFYTSLGHQDDFRNDRFLRLLTNAVLWVVGV